MNSRATPDIRSDFHRQGYVVIPKAIDARHIEGIFSDVERLFDEALAGLKLPSPKIIGADEKYAALKRLAPKQKSRVYDLIKYLDSLHLVARTGPIMESIKLLSKGPFLIDRVQIRIDDESNDRLLPLHQEVYGQISWRCINAWVPLVSVTPQSGALRIVPGSHTAGHLAHRFYSELNNAHGVNEENINIKDIVTPSLDAGDAVIFHPFLVHGSGTNAGDKTRWTMVARYNPIEQIPYLEDPGMPLYIEQQDAGKY